MDGRTVQDPGEEGSELHLYRTSGTSSCSGLTCSATACEAGCEFSGLKLELDPEPECDPDLRGMRSRPLSAVRLASFSPLASRSRSLTPTLPIPSPTLASGLKRPTGLSVLRLSRSENEDVRVTLRPRECSTCAWEGNDEADTERPRNVSGSEGVRNAPPVPWMSALGRGATVAELEEVTLAGGAMIGEGVRERDLLWDLERDLDRGMSGWPSGELTMTSGRAGHC